VTKLFIYEICPTEKQAQIKKLSAKMLWTKIKFSAIMKIAAILKTGEKIPNFFNI
jgi:hypothetical protein